MFRKILAFTAFSIVGVGIVNAQTAPSAPTDKTERRARAMVLTAPFERSYLGVKTQEITKENFSQFGLANVRGVGIEKVVENSPAANAGLLANDVIIKFDGESIESVGKLLRLIAEVAPDHTAAITVLRGGSEREINVTLGKREGLPIQGNFNLGTLPNIQAMPDVQVLPNVRTLPRAPMGQMRVMPPISDGDGGIFILRGGASRQIGVGVEPLTKQLAEYFGVADGKGLLVSTIRENSPAMKAGLKAGDVIVEADNKPVVNQMDLIRAISGKKEGDVALTIIRDRNRQTLRVMPEMIKDGAVNMESLDNLFETKPGDMNFRFQSSPESQLAPLPALFTKKLSCIL